EPRPQLPRLWKSCGQPLRRLPLGRRAQPLAQDRAQRRALRRRLALTRRLVLALLRRSPQPSRVPELDVQELDLVDQHQDRAGRGAHLVAVVPRETVGPEPQRGDLLLVEPPDHYGAQPMPLEGIVVTRRRRPSALA